MFCITKEPAIYRKMALEQLFSIVLVISTSFVFLGWAIELSSGT